MADEDFPDIEGALRTWLRLQATVTDVVAQRIFFALPVNIEESEYPVIVLSRVGGGLVDQSTTALDVSTIQFDCWGGRNRKDQALAAANALRKVLNGIRGRTEIVTGVVVFGAEVDTVIFLPDPADSRPRYVVQATVSAISI